MGIAIYRKRTDGKADSFGVVDKMTGAELLGFVSIDRLQEVQVAVADRNVEATEAGSPYRYCWAHEGVKLFGATDPLIF